MFVVTEHRVAEEGDGIL